MRDLRSKIQEPTTVICLLCGLLLGSSSTPAVAQLRDPPPIEWDRAVDWTSASLFWDATFLPDGSAVFVGTAPGPGDIFVPQGFVLKVDSEANVLWATTIVGRDRGPFEPRCVAPTAEGGCIVGANWLDQEAVFHGSLIKVHADGMLDWQGYYLGVDLLLFLDVKETADRGFVGVAFATDKRQCVIGGPPGPDTCDLLLLRTDAQGRELWRQQVFDLPEPVRGPFGVRSFDFFEVREAPSGDIFVFYSVVGFPLSARSRRVHLIQVNANGNVLSSRSIDDIEVCPDGSLPGDALSLTAVNACLRLAADGKSVCKRFILADDILMLVPYMDEASDGTLLAKVWREPLAIRTVRIDARGQTLWETKAFRGIGPLGGGLENPGRKTADGGYQFLALQPSIFRVGMIKLGPEPAAPPAFRRGDANGDAAVNLTDAVFVLRALFQGGPQPACADAADADDSGTVNISDPIYLLQHLFLGQAAPPPPGPAACGADPTADDLACAGAAGC